jgi:hypothetical protein
MLSVLESQCGERGLNMKRAVIWSNVGVAPMATIAVAGAESGRWHRQLDWIANRLEKSGSMLNILRKYWYSAALISALVAPGLASPLGSKLLPLVPAGAEIVAGIEDPHNPDSHGRVLLVTRSNNLDFTDWVALTAVDAHRGTDEVIEVAASSNQGELKERLLLVEGHFDGEHIFHAAEQNGSSKTEYKGQAVLLVKPFPREQQVIADTRWMAILDNHIAIFGTPLLVQKALDRRADHSTTDALLAQRVAQLHPDVNSWNVLAMSSAMFARHVAPEELRVGWTHILDGADELTVGIHYGSTTRVDFAAHTNGDQQRSEFAGEFSPPQMLRAGLSQSPRMKLERLSVERDRIEGSIAVPETQFEAWLAAIYSRRSANSPSEVSKTH